MSKKQAKRARQAIKVRQETVSYAKSYPATLQPKRNGSLSPMGLIPVGIDPSTMPAVIKRGGSHV